MLRTRRHLHLTDMLHSICVCILSLSGEFAKHKLLLASSCIRFPPEMCLSLGQSLTLCLVLHVVSVLIAIQPSRAQSRLETTLSQKLDHPSPLWTPLDHLSSPIQATWFSREPTSMRSLSTSNADPTATHRHFQNLLASQKPSWTPLERLRYPVEPIMTPLEPTRSTVEPILTQLKPRQSLQDIFCTEIPKVPLWNHV